MTEVGINSGHLIHGYIAVHLDHAGESFIDRTQHANLFGNTTEAMTTSNLPPKLKSTPSQLMLPIS